MTQDGTRQYVKYTLFKVAPQWRRLPQGERERSKTEFTAVVDEFAPQMSINTYSLLGTRGDVDFMLWKVSPSLELLDGLAAQLNRTELGKYLAIPHSYLAMTRRSPYVDKHGHPGQEGTGESLRAIGRRYLFLYPFVKDPRLVPAAQGRASAHDERALPGGPQVPFCEDQHQLLLRAGRSGVRSGLRDRRPLGLPGAGDGPEGVRRPDPIPCGTPPSSPASTSP